VDEKPKVEIKSEMDWDPVEEPEPKYELMDVWEPELQKVDYQMLTPIKNEAE